MQNNYNNQVTYGGFFVRLAAYTIDSILVGVGLLTVRMVLWGSASVLPEGWLSNGLVFQYSGKDIILYLCGIAYFVIITYCTGTTLGKKAMNLRVVSKSGEKLSLFTVVYRETVGRFLCAISMGIGYIMIGANKEKCGLHDMICDTNVVYEKTVRVISIPIQMTPMPQFANREMGTPIQEGNLENESRGL